jgi:hypothetical protein
MLYDRRHLPGFRGSIDSEIADKAPMTALYVLLAISVSAFTGLALLAAYDRADIADARAKLLLKAPIQPQAFDPGMVDALPEPARRYFRFAIRPGARLATVAEITLEGEISLGTRQNPGYQPMRATQILASPHGFVWEVAATPAALLPMAGVSWSQVDADTARVTVNHAGLLQSVDVRVALDGRPMTVVMPRWSNSNPGANGANSHSVARLTISARSMASSAHPA